MTEKKVGTAILTSEKIAFNIKKIETVLNTVVEQISVGNNRSRNIVSIYALNAGPAKFIKILLTTLNTLKETQ